MWQWNLLMPLEKLGWLDDGLAENWQRDDVIRIHGGMHWEQNSQEATSVGPRNVL